ncbi:MAG: hypothetical protein ACLR2E_17130 [Lachnospiraceae bacterium]
MVTFFRYFTAHTNASNQYMGVAKARIGEKMTGEESDPLTIRLIPTAEGSTRKEPYDSDGNCGDGAPAFRGRHLPEFLGKLRSTLTI